MMICNGTGNTMGPRTKQTCTRCGTPKYENAFKMDNRHGYRERVCRACRGAAERQRARRTPIFVPRASAMGESTDGRWASSRCPECGEAICFDTDGRGRLVALDRRGLGIHRHQEARRA